jgi:hypothetical protein
LSSAQDPAGGPRRVLQRGRGAGDLAAKPSRGAGGEGDPRTCQESGLTRLAGRRLLAMVVSVGCPSESSTVYCSKGKASRKLRRGAPKPLLATPRALGNPTFCPLVKVVKNLESITSAPRFEVRTSLDLRRGRQRPSSSQLAEHSGIYAWS